MMIQCRRFGQDVENDPRIDRNYLARLWVADRKMKNSTRRRGRKVAKRGHYYDNQSSYLNSLDRLFSGYLEPEYPEEAHVEPLLARSNLLITRDIEWANLVLGFEQENRYAIVDVCYPESPVGFIRGQSNVIAGQGEDFDFCLWNSDKLLGVCILDALIFLLKSSIAMLGSQTFLVDNQFNLCRDQWKLVWVTDDGIFGGGFMICT
ncbi:hypothetical protein FEM48_Zijuj03G0195500 [Ziziphus jujuba var. spinosa]|uniref:Phospholipid scramblase n=1 Tax=Ziziphus jujuba var. spinosa TaxID=714518 RepID=A0A978VS75_ZIZJJ|nr:hypothetical protein FEM48_Zijuj03G0195500 [Ziziphus jujuba var. spinosa]